jgi:CRP/FNR family transcriptional regulator, cyclic AMP receptor protein
MPTSKPAPRDLIATAPVSESLRKLASAGEVRRYNKGTLLIHEGGKDSTLYVVLAGELRAYSVDPETEREITFGVYGPGEYVGEMSLDGGARSANVITQANTVCACIERPTLEAHIAQHPGFAFELISKVIWRARAATQGMRMIVFNNVYGRLKVLLDTLAAEQADGTRLIAPAPTHRELAARVSCGREMVSRVMKDLERGGYVAAEAGRLVLVRRLPPKW